MFWRPFRRSQLTDYHSKISHRQLAATLLAAPNRYSLIRNRTDPLTTNEKTFSNRCWIRYLFPRVPPRQLPLANRVISIRYEWNSQNHHSVENKRETTFYSIQICPSWHSSAHRRRALLPMPRPLILPFRVLRSGRGRFRRGRRLPRSRLLRRWGRSDLC
jgi:hypothetical protein